MHLELATVVSCHPGGCRVMPLESGQPFDARYSALVLNKVRILPGQLVAVDMDTEIPEIAWRWYRVRVVDASDPAVTVQERERQLSAARVPGLETDLRPGDELWLTGMSGTWELHDTVLNDQPAHPARLYDLVLPRIVEMLEVSE